MNTGRTCEKHNQWCPDGVCLYCPGLRDMPKGVNPVMVLHFHEAVLDRDSIRRFLDGGEFLKALREWKGV